jgi:hypothetical protein
MNVKAMLDTKFGSILISVLFGLGLAAVFRRVCKDNRCIVIKGPKLEELNKYTYKVNSDCFKYSPVFTECPDDEESVQAQ